MKNVKKLTSEQIKWENGMNWAVVCKKDNNAIRDQYCGMFTKRINKYNDVLICFGAYKYSAKHFYLIKRNDNKKTVVDAVNYLKAEITKENCTYEGTERYLASSSTGRLKVLALNNIESLRISGFGFICTIEEFNQCVKELSEAAWMNDGEPMFYDVYKIAYRDMVNAETVENYKAVEWKNGDECVLNGIEDVATYIGLADNRSKCWISFHPCTAVKVPVSMLSKPETPQQKAAREREDMAKRLHEIYIKKHHGKTSIMQYISWDKLSEKTRNNWLGLVDCGVTIKE